VRYSLFVVAAFAAICPAQHLQFGPLHNQGTLIVRPAADSHGNLVALVTALQLGFHDTRLVNLLVRYGRDASVRILADTGIEGSGEGVAFLAVDNQDRVYVGQNRQGEPLLMRFGPDQQRRETTLFVPFTRLVGMAFAPGGDPVIVGTDFSPEIRTIQVVRLDATTMQPVARRLITGAAGTPSAMAVGGDGAVYVTGQGPFVVKLSPDLQSVVYKTQFGGTAIAGGTAIQAAPDGSVYVGGYILSAFDFSSFPLTEGAFQTRLPREPQLWTSGRLVVGPSTAFITRFSADGSRALASTLLAGSMSESIDGLELDQQGRVIAHGSAISRDFPATGVFTTPCGPDRGRLFRATFLTRLDAGLERVEKSIVAAGLDSRGLPGGPVHGSVFLSLGGSLALADFDRDEPSAVACVVSGASYEGLPGVTPGQLVTIFGRDLGPEPLAAFESAGAALPTIADDTEVLFNGERAAILAASGSQLNVVAPQGLDGNVWMEINRRGERVFLRNLRFRSTNPAPLLRIAPEGRAIATPEAPYFLLADAFNEDGSANSAENPAAPGSVVTVLATGLGSLNAPLPITGFGDGVARPALDYVVRWESGRIEPLEIRTAPGRTIAVIELRFRIPDEARNTFPFSIELPDTSGSFVPANFVFVGR
jgi:uncharacterized protein (TIGR03437 family)